MNDNNRLETKVSEYIRLTQEAAELKVKIEALKGWFEARGVEDLNATKIKTVDYWGDNGKVEVGRSETVSPVALTILKQIFGELFDELVKEKKSFEMTAPCKQLLAPIFLGNYIETSMNEIIEQLTDNEKARATLKKKLRGNFKKDKAALISIAGLSEKDAEYYAYMTAESTAYAFFCQILSAAKYKGTPEQAKEIIMAAVVVEEGVKVTVESADI
jgi:hypothetical protein